MKVIQMGDPILERKSRAVDDPKSVESQKMTKGLLDIVRADAGRTAGLSAPQVGKNIRHIVVRRVDLEDEYRKKGKEDIEELEKKLWEVMINPKILKLGKKKTTFWEGCLSIEEGNVFGPVTRPALVKIRYLDRYGNSKTLTAVNFLSHVVQHEIDHLEGILFVKYIKNPKNLWRSEALDDYMKKHGDFPEVKE